jgi:hypothetical protein
MAKTAKTEAPKKEKKERGPKEIFLPLSSVGSENQKVMVMHVRGKGVLVSTQFLNNKGEVVSGSTQWITGLKPKSKKGERFLVEDKGPKPKKEKASKKS